MAIKLEHNDDFVECHEINVTPFIDVVLVLLIIFMVAAPLATVDVNVELPASTAEPTPRPEQPIFLTIKGAHKVVLGTEPVSFSELGAALDRAAKGNKQPRIFLRADESVDYGVLMRALNALRSAGYLKVALVGLEKAG